MYENKKIFILGMARSGYEAAKLLKEKGCTITITDINEQDEEKVKELENLGIKIFITKTPEEILDDSFDFVVKNPGIKIDHPVCLKAEGLNISVINEVEVAYSFLPEDVTIIGITGSNGKTTTTTITYEILKSAGLPVHLGGNIGYPVCSLVNMVKQGDILVLEISGHQLHDAPFFKAHIGIMTNLSEAHLDHFGTYENYKQNKSYIFRHHTSKDIAIINKDDFDVLDITKNIPSHKIYFSSKEKADLCIENNGIYYHDERIIDLNSIRIKGIHNYENIMCAIAAVKQFNVSNEIIEEVLEKFVGVEHRIEFVRKLNEREFYNDSKSTNVKSTQTALSAFTKPTILLLGGLDRGHNFDDLKNYIKNVKAIVGYGQMKDKASRFANKNQIDNIITDTLESAVKIAYNLSEEGDVILLSPACASWDQYKDFEQRGKDFKKHVENLCKE